MRTIKQSEANKESLQIKQSQGAILSYPPGYLKGLRLSTENNQLIIGKGVMNCRGVGVNHTTEHIVAGEEYLQSNYIIPGLTYRVFMNKDRNVIVDTVDEEWDDTYYAYYHPTLWGYRFLGQFLLGVDRTYTNIINQDPILGTDIAADTITALHLTTGSVGTTQIADDSISTAKLQADSITAAKIAANAIEAEHMSANAAEFGLLNTTTAYIGFNSFSGTTTLLLPGEGDTVVKYSNMAIEFLEYTNTGWTTVNGAKIGGFINSLFLSMVGATGIYHPSNPPSTSEYLPHPSFRVFNFANNYQDQNGVDDWVAKTLLEFTTTRYKFGSYALKATDANYGTLFGGLTGTFGESQLFGGWFYIDVSGEADVGRTFSLMSMEGTQDFIYVYIEKTTLSNELKIRVVVDKNGTGVLNETYNKVLSLGVWHTIYVTYDKTDDKIKTVIDNEIFTSSDLSGTWAGDAMSYIIGVAEAALDTNTVWTVGLDEFLYYADVTVSPYIIAQHYTHNVAWTTTYSKADILIGPDTDGRAYIEGDLHVTGEFTGSAWISFTPTITNLSVGDGTVVAAYKRIGKTVVFRVSVVFGSTTAISGALTLALPIAIRSGIGNPKIGIVSMTNSGTATHVGVINASGVIRAHAVSGSYVIESDLSSTVPFAWASTDILGLSGLYESE